LFAVEPPQGPARFFATGSASPYFLNSAAAMSLARDKGFAAQALAAGGVPHIPGRLFFANDRHKAFRAPGREPADARAAARDFQYPVFCKPVSGSKGDYAELIPDEAAFEDYLHRVATRHDAFLVQPLIRGVEHRVIVLQGEALCAYEKTPLTVTGDGRLPLATLVEAARASAPPTTATLAPAGSSEALDGEGGRWRAKDIPPFGALMFAGVDVFDVSPTGDLSDLTVIEANASPALLTLEAHGRLDLVDRIWTANLRAAFA
jgi:glutathione synthase/RimK-type ligase-like ATP-grasp enzyme